MLKFTCVVDAVKSILFMQLFISTHVSHVIVLLSFLLYSGGRCCGMQILNRKEPTDDFEIWDLSCRHQSVNATYAPIPRNLEESRQIIDVARKFDIARNVVSRLCITFQRIGMCSRCCGEVIFAVWWPQKQMHYLIGKKRLANHSLACDKLIYWCNRQADISKNYSHTFATR